MKHGLFVFAYLFFSCIFYSQASLANDDNLPNLVQIVGGEEAEENQWPWMTALVFIEKRKVSSVSINADTIDSTFLAFSPVGDVTAELADCMYGGSICLNVKDKVCLIKRGSNNELEPAVTFYEKALNCEAGGGVGLIIFNNVEGSEGGFTLLDDFAGNIPVVAVSLKSGEILLDSAIGKEVRVSVSEEGELSQSSNCGASLIDRKWLLTAAHCVENDISNLYVNIGAYDLTKGAESAVRARAVYIHPDYNYPTILENDIALVELDTPFNIEPLDIASLVDLESLALQNSPAIALGWGSTLAYEAYSDFTPQSYPDVLRQVDLQLYNTQECQDIVRNADDLLSPSPNSAGGIKDNMLCAGAEDGSRDVCNGDSGGPLIVETNTGWQQVGIVSWGEGCAAPGYPTKFTKLALYKNWIDSHLNGIAMQEIIDFGATSQGETATKELILVNNTSEVVNLSFNLMGDNTFAIKLHNCLDVLPEQDCLLTIEYSPLSGEAHGASLELIVNGEVNQSVHPELFGDMVVSAESLASIMDTDNDVAKWYTTENRPWHAGIIEGVVESPSLGEGRFSKLVLFVEGSGKLQFDWQLDALDSELPDWVYLEVNGITIAYLLPTERAIEQIDLRLPKGRNQLTWVYYKSTKQSEQSDKAYIKNVVFTPAPSVTEFAFLSRRLELEGNLFESSLAEETDTITLTENDTTTTDTTITRDSQLSSDTNSGGGSFFYLLPFCILLRLMRLKSRFSSLAH